MDTDPHENYNVADQHQDIVEIMIGKLAGYDAGKVDFQFLPIECESDADNFGGVFRPWRPIWNTTGLVFPLPFPGK